MFLTCDLAIVDGMTGNQLLDTFLIIVAGVFFVAAGAFLPFWEYTQGRGARHHRRHDHHDHQRGAGVSA